MAQPQERALRSWELTIANALLKTRPENSQIARLQWQSTVSAIAAAFEQQDPQFPIVSFFYYVEGEK